MVELWLQYALVTAGIYAVISLVDKVVSDTELPNPAAAMVLNSLPRFLTFVIIGAIGGNVFLGSIEGLWARRLTLYIAIGTGGLYAVGMIAWYRGIAGADVSTFIPLFSTKTIFTTLLAFLFLGESFSVAVYVAIAIIVAGAVLISLEDLTDGVAVRSWTGVYLALFTAGAFAVIYTSLKGLAVEIDIWSVLFWIGIGGTVVTLDFAVLKREEIVDMRVSGQGPLVVNGGLSAVAFFVFTKAVAVGPVSLVTAVVNLDAALVFLAAVALSGLSPVRIEESTDLPTLVQKGVATVLILGGAGVIELFA